MLCCHRGNNDAFKQVYYVPISYVPGRKPVQQPEVSAQIDSLEDAMPSVQKLYRTICY